MVISERVRVKVLDAKTDEAVSPTKEFTSDDRLKVVIESNFESYAYVVKCRDNKEDRKALFTFESVVA